MVARLTMATRNIFGQTSIEIRWPCEDTTKGQTIDYAFLTWSKPEVLDCKGENLFLVF